ncbi:MAG: RDD family protein [Elusimicrobiaceae bacterium]|nr:RDD family protein [Elusimicrobiaceae bacterium]
MKNPYIGFFRRAAAFVIDSLLVSLLPALLCLPFLFWQVNVVQQLPEGATRDAVAVQAMALLYTIWLILNVLAFWLYFAGMESGTKQSTWGKRLLRIKVIGNHGERISFARASGRLFAKILSYLPFYLGYIMAGCTSRNRALHDIIAETYVVHRDFQPGDELPRTQSHPFYLGFWCLLFASIFFTAVILSSRQNNALQKNNEAAQRLMQLAQEKAPLIPPLTENGNKYFHHADGYRVLVNDGYQNTLFLGEGKQNVCCEDSTGNNCAATGYPVCR